MNKKCELNAEGLVLRSVILNLMLDSERMDGEIIWILVIYVQLVWDVVTCKNKKLKTMKSEYKMKYSTHQKSNVPHLNYIVGLLN